MFFQPNRVWRCYKGGKLLDKLMGNGSGEDTLYPENWLGSVTRADNGEHSTCPDEGISRLRSGELFSDILAENSRELLGTDGREPGVLCKFLDSAIRLPFQCHPDREFARKYCNSEYGKTESWFILDTRKIDGEEPYILLGFKPGIDRKAFRRAVLEQDIPAVLDMMHKIPVKPGDNFFIPGRIPHAIGTGVLMLEVQEPTDLVIQPERKIGDITLSDKDMWQMLTVEQGLDCFEYKGRTLEEIKSELVIPCPDAVNQTVPLVDSDRTDCFRVSLLRLEAGRDFSCSGNGKWQLAAVTAGRGKVCAGTAEDIAKGDCFFVPATVKEMTFTAGNDGLNVFLIQK